MKMQVQEGKHCMLYALAMLMDIPASSILARLKYKGDGERSWHIQEMMDVLMSEGKSLILVESDPYCTDPVNLTQTRVYTSENHRMEHYMDGAPGLILVRRDGGTSFHCCSWDGKNCYDPQGTITEGVQEEVWAFLRLVNL